MSADRTSVDGAAADGRFDLGPATEAVARLVAAIPADALDRRTPCPDWSVGDLLDHLGGLALAFTWAAAKDERIHAAAPEPSATSLPADWSTQVPERLRTLAEAWRDPAAWTGMTAAGGVDLPGSAAALVALDEVVVHGWDLARATGLAYEPDAAAVAACLTLFEPADGEPDALPQASEIFGPAVPVPESAPSVHVLLGRSGRDPGWAPDRTA